MTAYQTEIAKIVIMNPRHVEAFMRNDYGALDALPPERFEAAAKDAAISVALAGYSTSEKLAESFGL